jgi:hypothetical protein
MMHCNWDYWVSGFCPLSDVLKNTACQELDLFPSSGKTKSVPTFLVHYKELTSATGEPKSERLKQYKHLKSGFVN